MDQDQDRDEKKATPVSDNDLEQVAGGFDLPEIANLVPLKPEVKSPEKPRSFAEFLHKGRRSW